MRTGYLMSLRGNAIWAGRWLCAGPVGNLQRRWLIVFVVGSLCGIIVLLFIFWLVGGFEALGLDGAGPIALVLGTVFTSALGVALTALVFYSDRIEADENAYRVVTSGTDREHDAATNDRDPGAGRS